MVWRALCSWGALCARRETYGSVCRILAPRCLPNEVRQDRIEQRSVLVDIDAAGNVWPFPSRARIRPDTGRSSISSWFAHACRGASLNAESVAMPVHLFRLDFAETSCLHKDHGAVTSETGYHVARGMVCDTDDLDQHDFCGNQHSLLSSMPFPPPSPPPSMSARGTPMPRRSSTSK